MDFSRLACCSILFLALLLTPALAAQDAPATLVLINANMIDGTGAPPLRDATVFVENGKIARIATSAVTPPATAQVIDLEGRYLLPGLIDAHTHVSTVAGLRRALESGVTTLRSASTSNYQDIGLRELVRQGKLPGPEVLAAGVFTPPEGGQSFLADPRLAELFPGAETADHLRHIVRVNLDRGVDHIKTRGTDRAGLPNTDPRRQSWTEDELRAVVEEAAKGGVPVMAHAHGDEGGRAAVLAGVRSIEHGTYLNQETLRLMKERDVYLVPTYTTVVDLVEPGGDYDHPTLRIRGEHMLARMGRTVQRAHEIGVKVVASTDTEYGPESITRVHMEAVNFVKLGLSPMEAIRSATVVAAELLQVDDRTGKIQQGFEADLIVVHENPLEDIHALQDIVVVVSNGEVALNRLPFRKQ
jgi:imidazolonepropionase-like amidohydrolase